MATLQERINRLVQAAVRHGFDVLRGKAKVSAAEMARLTNEEIVAIVQAEIARTQQGLEQTQPPLPAA